jgi:ABC-type dipeptide/oligopeptide/nickel transport system permease subunit
MSIRALDTVDSSAAVAVVSEAQAPPRRAVWRKLRRHRSALFGLSVIGFYVVVAIVGPFVLTFNPAHNELTRVLNPPSPRHLLGTDNFGRDELDLLVYGARYTLSIGVMAVALGLAIGVPFGLVSGYFGGWIDLALQRLTDILLAFPGILLALALVAGLGVGLRNVVIAVGVSSVPGFIRLIRASTLSIRELPYVEAARGLGVPSWMVLARHVLPNAVAPIIVQATLQLGFAILLAATLGFFGLGVQPPTPEWGSLLGEGRNYIFTDANLITFPGLAIFFAVLAFNLVGDGLRDAFDPRLV